MAWETPPPLELLIFATIRALGSARIAEIQKASGATDVTYQTIHRITERLAARRGPQNQPFLNFSRGEYSIALTPDEVREFTQATAEKFLRDFFGGDPEFVGILVDAGHELLSANERQHKA
jgi:hypothetical protein